jgi:hypothetical protein
MFGYELNLKSPDFQKLMQTTVQLSDKINIAGEVVIRKLKNHTLTLSKDMFTRALLVVASSGDTAVSATFSLPGIFTFNHFFYLNSTSTSHSVAAHSI